MGKVVFQKREYEVADGLLKEFGKLEIEITEEYLESLWNYHSVYDTDRVQVELSKLMETAIYNSIYLWQNGMGGIIEYGPNGDIRNTYRTVDDMIANTNESTSIYGFECYNDQGNGITRKGIDFFGIKFKPLYDQMSWRYRSITYLNIAMRSLRSWENRTSFKSFEDPYFKSKIGDLSFNEYQEQFRKNFIFSIVRWFLNSDKETRLLAKRATIDANLYEKELEKLLMRYTKNGIRFFEKVSNLADYKKCAGIYIFCLKNVRSYYIGQASTDIQTRIKRHWSEPSNTFDKTFGPTDVSDIYVLRLNSKYLNRVEQDCIAIIHENYLTNKFVGGNEIACINSPLYDSEVYKMSKEELDEVLNILQK